MFDLLAQRFLHLEGAPSASLPGALALLAQGEDLRFLNLRPHQQPAWHAFLVQLGYHVLSLANLDEPPVDEAAWRNGLLSLAGGQPQAWHLVVDDWLLPAFLQPPCLPGGETDYRSEEHSIQGLDLLVTSKNFDEKAEKAAGLSVAQADSIVYALVSLQGWAPFQGAGNYSVMRMNGGFSARSQFRLVQARGTAAEWRRDLRALLAQQPTFLQPCEPGDIGSQRALRLLWTEAWGDPPLPLADVHPLALEVARRVRVIAHPDGALSVRRAGSKCARVDAKVFLGAVRDPWMPLLLNDGPPKALTPTRETLGYKRLSTLLFDADTCQLPLLARPAPTDDAQSTSTLVAQFLVGGQGASDGLVRRELPMPPHVLGFMLRGEARLPLRAQRQIKDAGLAWGKCLRSALIQYLDGDTDVAWKHPDFDRMATPWGIRWDNEVDAVFFDHLFADVDQDDATARERWVRHLASMALQLFDAAVAALPTRSASPRMALARAERLLHNGWRNHLGSPLRPAPQVHPEEATT